MAYIKIKTKYPCGYEKEIVAKTGIFDTVDGHFDSNDTCPLHGKNCSKKK